MQLGRDLELPEGTCGGSKPDFFGGGYHKDYHSS